MVDFACIGSACMVWDLPHIRSIATLTKVTTSQLSFKLYQEVEKIIDLFSPNINSHFIDSLFYQEQAFLFTLNAISEEILTYPNTDECGTSFRKQKLN